MADTVTGLESGGDYYLTKPFSFDELRAVVRVMARKYTGNRTNEYRIADLVASESDTFQEGLSEAESWHGRKEEGIRRDGNLDYSCGLYDEDYEIVGTGSCFGNTLRCFAVDRAHQGEGLLNQVVTQMIEAGANAAEGKPEGQEEKDRQE